MDDVDPDLIRVRARMRSWDLGVQALQGRDVAEPVGDQVRDDDNA